MTETTSIAIVGAGRVGAALGGRLGAAGYPIHFGVREGKEVGELLDSVRAAGAKQVSTASPAEACAEASIVFLALPAAAVVEVAGELGELGGKIIVDCANPVRWDAGPVWDPPPAGSTSQALAAALADSGARIIKAFNGFGAEFHGDPKLGDEAIDVFMAGDDAEAKAVLAAVARSAGFSPVDAGPLRNAGVLENVAILWIHLATAGGLGRDIGLKLLRR